MRILTLFLMLIALTSCGEDTTKPPAGSGKIEVYIYWHQQGLPDKQVEIVESGDSGMTDRTGLVHFDLPAGRYTVRAYNINRGGPCCGYVDEPAEVWNGQTVRVEIADCLLCLAPSRISNN